MILTNISFGKILIPDLTINALQEGLGHFGVSSSKNKTVHVDTLGVKIDNIQSTLTCFVINSECKKVLQYLSETGRVSFFVGMISHEAYNFKGQFLSSKKLNNEDLKISEKYTNNVIDIITSVGLSKDAAVEKYGKVPDLGITFKVDKVYIQTPGPEAGKEITNSEQ